MKKTFLILILCISFLACERSINLPAPFDPCNTVTGLCEITGIIQKQGVTSYQYGTHIISEYALRSNSVILDDFINYNALLISMSLTIFYLYITSDNNLILKKNMY